MPIQLRRKTTTGAGINLLAAGELAVNTLDRKLYLGDGAANHLMLGGPVAAGSSTHESLRWDNATKEWVASSAFLLTTTGAEVPSSNTLVLKDNAILSFGDSNDFTVTFDATNVESDIHDGAILAIRDTTGPRLLLRTTGDVEFRGNYLYTGSTPTKLNDGFYWFRRLAQATYDGLTPDTNTIYFITA